MNQPPRLPWQPHPDAAIKAAKKSGEPDAEVIVQELNREQSTVWRASETK